MEAETTVISLKDLLRNTKPDEESGQAGGASTGGEELVPDFAPAGDYVEAVEEAEAEQAYAPSEANVQEPESVTAVGQPYYSGDQPGSYSEEEVADIPSMGVSLISKETTVFGDIVTGGHINIVGKVRGNVEAEGNVAVRGLVSGDLSGDKIGLYKCRVKGNLNADTGVVIDADSVVVGDVNTDNVVLGGKLKGDMKAVKMAVLRGDSYFIGDVETESIAVESGAVVNGNIRTLVQGDIEAPFDD